MRRIGSCWAMGVSGLMGLTSVGCDVESQAGPGGGVDLIGGRRGIAVVGGDFTSTTISLLGTDGVVQSASFLSSASTDPGLSAALGGDVVLPSAGSLGDELVVIDRFPAAVLTWVDLETATVKAQLSVATGFSSNPHDYVQVSATKAYVPRFEPNLAAGAEPFDGGNDVLVVDPESATITGRIDLAPALEGEAAGFYPRADRALFARDRLRVLSLGWNADFTASADSRLISIDPTTDAIEHVLVFEGMKGCGNARLAPAGDRLAVSCGGSVGADPALGFDDSGVILVDVTGEPVETARWTSEALGIGQINALGWLDDERLAVLTFGRFNADFTVAEADDEARTLDVGAGTVTQPWLAKGPFSLGDVTCSRAESTCFVADAETDGGVVHTLAVGDDGAVSLVGTVRPDPVSGLPPRSFGTY